MILMLTDLRGRITGYCAGAAVRAARSLFQAGADTPNEAFASQSLACIRQWGIEEAIVVAVDDEEWGRRPVAFVRMANQRMVHLRRFDEELKEVLPRYMIPQAVLPWPKDAVATGIKPSRADLKRRAQDA